MLRVILWLVGGIALACVGFVLFVQISLGGLGKGGFAFGRDHNALDSNLSYVSIAEFLQDVEAVQALALYDEGWGDQPPQWYLIPDPKVAHDAKVGLPPDRLLDSLFGRNVTVYCTSHGVSQGKILWAVHDGSPVKERVYCARRRMDLSQLIPLALPATEIDTDTLNAQAFTTLKAQIEATPQAAVTFASTLQPFSHTCQAGFPYIWQSKDDTRDWMLRRVEEGIKALVAGLGDADAYDLKIDTGYASNYVMHPAEGQDVSAEGWPLDTPYFWIRRGAEERKVPGLSLYRPKITLKADAATCTAFDALDFAPIWAEERDADLLDRAWQAGVSVAHPGGERAIAQSDLSKASAGRQQTREIMYRLRYLQAETTGKATSD